MLKSTIHALGFAAMATTAVVAAPVDFSESGGSWLYHKAQDGRSGNGILVSRGDRVLYSKGPRLTLNWQTGQADPASRAGFDSTTDYLAADGRGPVFWTRSLEDLDDATVSVRDWASGAVTSTFEMPEGMVMVNGLVDDLGVVGHASGAIRVMSHSGQMLGSLSTAGRSGTPEFFTGGGWLTVNYRNDANQSAGSIDVLDRNTLELKATVATPSVVVSAGETLLAREVGSVVRIHALPGLEVRSEIPLQAPAKGGATGLAVVGSGLWIMEFTGTDQRQQLRYFDLTDPTAPKPGHRLEPHGSMMEHPTRQAFIANDEFVAYGDDSWNLWVWRKGGSGPEVSASGPPDVREGGTAVFRLQLSYPVDSVVTVAVQATPGSAQEGQDFAATAQVVTIPAGSSEAEVTVPILQDAVLEANESFSLTLGETSGCVAGNDSAQAVIAANGFELDVQRKFAAGGTFRFEQAIGVDDGDLVSVGAAYPHAPPFLSRLVKVDPGNGQILWDFSGSVDATSIGSRFVKHGVLVATSQSQYDARRLSDGVLLASSVAYSGGIVGIVDAERVLVRMSWPDRVAMLRISDGAVLATRDLGGPNTTVALADEVTGIEGGAVVVFGIRTNPEGVHETYLEFLNPTSLEPVRVLAWPYFVPWEGSMDRLLAVSGDTVVLSGIRSATAIDAVTGNWRWTLPFLQPGGGSSGSSAISGELLALGGVQLKADTPSSAWHFIDTKTGVLVEALTWEQMAGTSTPSGSGGEWITPSAEGWDLGKGNQIVRVKRVPTRPNVVLEIEPFADNRSGELRLVPKENFAGTVPMEVGEYVELLQPIGASAAIFNLPQTLQLTAEGATVSLDVARAVSASVTARLRASQPGAWGEVAGYGKATINNHVTSLAEVPFFTGGPVRQSKAASLSIGTSLLAVGYPLETGPAGERAGVVDLYDRATGAFLRSLHAPTGAAGRRFGATAGISGNRVVIGAPGDGGSPALPGRVFVFDGTTGQMVRELKLGGSKAFGAAIAANDTWIAVSAPGRLGGLPPTGLDDRGRKLLPGTVAVFDAVTLKQRFKVTTKGEMLGWSLGLDGNSLFAGAPLGSLLVPARPYAGLVRTFTLPVGKTKARATAILASMNPEDGGHFGQDLAVDDGLLVVKGTTDVARHSGALQVHRLDGSGLAALFSMPGTEIEGGGLFVKGEAILASGNGDPLRVWDLDDFRPEASYQVPNPGPESPLTGFGLTNFVTDGSFIYWADFSLHKAPMPGGQTAMALKSAGGTDLNSDGAVNEIDQLLAWRDGKGLPARVRAYHPAAGAESKRRFEIALDSEMPPGMDVIFEASTDLLNWSTVCRWSAAESKWLDGKDRPVPSPDESGVVWEADSGTAFFRSRVIAATP